MAVTEYIQDSCNANRIRRTTRKNMEMISVLLMDGYTCLTIPNFMGKLIMGYTFPQWENKFDIPAFFSLMWGLEHTRSKGWKIKLEIFKLKRKEQGFFFLLIARDILDSVSFEERDRHF